MGPYGRGRCPQVAQPDLRDAHVQRRRRDALTGHVPAHPAPCYIFWFATTNYLPSSDCGGVSPERDGVDQPCHARLGAPMGGVAPERALNHHIPGLLPSEL